MTIGPLPPRASSTWLDTLRDWIATLVFWPSFVAVLVTFDLAQRITLLVSPRHHQRVVAALNQALVNLLRCIGVQIRISGEIPAKDLRPRVVVSNHQSLFDIPILHTAFHALEPRWIAKKELARWIPSISLNLRRGGNLVIDRTKGLSAARSLRLFAKEIRAHARTVVIFPEGTRSRDGECGTFHSAGISALLEVCPEIQVIPVTIDGGWKIAEASLWPIRPRNTIHIVIGSPISTAEPKVLVTDLSNAIRSSLTQLRYSDPIVIS